MDMTLITQTTQVPSTCPYHDLSKRSHLHDVLELLIHVSESELAWNREAMGGWLDDNTTQVKLQLIDFNLTMFQLVNQLLIVI